MQIEMYQHAFQISSIDVHCIWLERGLRRLRAIWIPTEGTDSEVCLPPCSVLWTNVLGLNYVS